MKLSKEKTFVQKIRAALKSHIELGRTMREMGSPSRVDFARVAKRFLREHDAVVAEATDAQEQKGRSTLLGVTKLPPRTHPVPVEAWEIQDPPVWVEFDSTLGQITIGRIDSAQCDLPWYDLWNIKNLVVGEEAFAVEVFPELSHLVDGMHHRHLWVIAEQKPGWRKRTCEQSKDAS